MSSTLTLVDRQPVAIQAAIIGAVTALVHVAVVVGWIPVDAEDSIAGAVDALGALLLVILAIRSVTPNAKVISRVTTDGRVVAGDASTLTTGAEVPVVDDGDPKVVPLPVHRGLLDGYDAA